MNERQKMYDLVNGSAMRERKHAVAETAMKQIIRKKGIASYVSPIKQQNRRGGGEEGFCLFFPFCHLSRRELWRSLRSRRGATAPRSSEVFPNIHSTIIGSEREGRGGGRGKGNVCFLPRSISAPSFLFRQLEWHWGCKRGRQTQRRKAAVKS